MSQSVFSESELEQIELDRKRALLHTYLVSGLPTSVEHEKRLKEQARLRAVQASRPIEPTSSEENGTVSTRAQFNQKQLSIEECIKICSPQLQRWVEARAKFDTGTPDNWISFKKAEYLQLSVERDEGLKYETFTGEVVESSMVVKDVTWRPFGPDSRSWETTFRIAPENAPFEVLFGSDFLDSKEIYSFNKANLILARKRGTKGDKKTSKENEARVEKEAEELERDRRRHETTSAQTFSANGGSHQSRIKKEEKHEGSTNYEYGDEMELDD